MARGRFFVLEGADGVGTTTQATLLAQALRAQGRRVIVTAEPSTGPIGVMIRNMLRGPTPRDQIHEELALLFAADRLDHVHREIEPALADDVDVISDRYVLSSLVYQSLDLPLAWVRDLNARAPAATATVLVELDVDTALARVDARGLQKDLFEVRAVQERVHARYRELAHHVHAVVVDGSGSKDDVQARVQRAFGIAP